MPADLARRDRSDGGGASAGTSGARADPVHPAWARIRPWVERLDAGSRWVVIAAMGAMTIMISLQVFWRYVLESSIDSADELSRLFFVWVIFLSIPHGVRYSVHVGIDLLVAFLRHQTRERLFRLVSALSALLMLSVFYAAVIATMDKWQEMMPTLSISAGVYYVAVLISAAHSFVHLLLFALFGRNAWGAQSL
ncbi:MAG TPA: TRAP transporter small permease [Burkholderiaceae bacterium]|jgi:TRAP-type transport system small permease protein|nr:TRAP transporter small permease [Burkholderiaceae bacterium]